MIDAADIIAKARSWIGTPFLHQGRMRKTSDEKGGVDCAGLIVGVYQDCYPTLNYVMPVYPEAPKGNIVLNQCFKYLKKKESDRVVPGQIAVMRYLKEPIHLGIIGCDHQENLTLIHAYKPLGKVVEHQLSEDWVQRITACFTF